MIIPIFSDWASILFEYFMGITYSITLCVFFYQLEKVPREGQQVLNSQRLVSLPNHVGSNWANADSNS